jgi:hypothetical protein
MMSASLTSLMVVTMVIGEGNVSCSCLSFRTAAATRKRDGLSDAISNDRASTSRAPHGSRTKRTSCALSHDIAERCRAVIDARHNPHNPHGLFHQFGASRGGRDHCQSCLGNFRNGEIRKSGRGEVISGLPLRPYIVAVTALVSLGLEADSLRLIRSPRRRGREEFEAP